MILADDFDNTIQHYNRTQPNYLPVYEYPEGDDISFNRLGGDGTTDNLSSGTLLFAQIKLETAVPDLRALAFTLEYDPLYFDNFFVLNSVSTDSEFKYHNLDGAVDYAAYLQDPALDLSPRVLFTLELRIADDFAEPFPAAETHLRFRNIRAYLTDGTAVDLGAQEVLVRVTDLVNSTKEPAWAQAIHLFPNPVNDQLQMESRDTRIESIQLYSSKDQLLKTFEDDVHEIDIRQFPAGMYYLRLFSAGDFVVRKFVKM